MLLVHIDHRELVDIHSDALQIVSCTFLKRSRHTECNDYTGDCGMDTGIEHHVPEHQTDCHVERLATHLQDICKHHDCHTCSGKCKVKEIDIR